MSRHKRFEDINGNVEIQDVLRDLYDDPDLVELYPGLFCEGNGDWDAKKKTGSNLDPGTSCPSGNGTALWRGVFSDAVTLVRSDRFYTIVSCPPGCQIYGVWSIIIFLIPTIILVPLLTSDTFAIGLECCIPHRMGYA